MKKIFGGLFLIFNVSGFAETITLDWLNEDGTTNQTTTCESGGDIILPSPPTKYGYTFIGWDFVLVQLEYLESTGTQWIDTGIVPKPGMRIKTEVSTNTLTYNNSSFFFGSRTTGGYADSNDQFYGGFENNNNGSIIFCISGTNKNAIQQSPLINTFYNVECINSTASSIGDNPITVFGFNIKGENFSHASFKIKYYKIWNERYELIMDLIPVLDSMGTPCMYDNVTNQYFYNQGTGDFIAGPTL